MNGLESNPADSPITGEHNSGMDIIGKILADAPEIDSDLKNLLINKGRQVQVPGALKERLESGIENEQRRQEVLAAVEAGLLGYMICEELQGKVDPWAGKSDDNRQVYSQADLLSSKVIATILSERFPNYGRLDEEVKPEDAFDEDKCWITDPLDGSAAYVRGIDWWAVGLALHEKLDIDTGGSGISFGVIVRPGRNGPVVLVGGKELGGCWDQNGRPIHTSEIVEPKMMSFSIGSRDVRVPNWITALQAIGQKTSRLFSGVDTQYAATLVAGGNLEFLVRAEQPSYDIAPLIGIVEGAGGAVLELDGTRVIVQRDKERRHNILAHNGKPEVVRFFNSIFGAGFDTTVAIDASNFGTDRMKEAKLVDAIRTGSEYQTACVLPKHEGKFFIRQVNRFGIEGDLKWDFGMSKPVTPDEAREMSEKNWSSIHELGDLSSETRGDLDSNRSMPDLDPAIDSSHPAQMELLGKINWPDGNLPVDYSEEGNKDFIRGLAFLGIKETIPPNDYFPNGGVSNELAHCMVVDVQNQEIVPVDALRESRWVTDDELRQMVKEGNLTHRLKQYVEDKDFDRVWEPQEVEETVETVKAGGY
jgi:fructose-1,6-bisphosphatase/inositol monophosphatase family enzyme